MNMFIPTLIMGALATILFIVAWRRGNGAHITGLTLAARMTAQILPLLIFAFIVAGFAQILAPQQALARWVGVESGWRGIFIGALAGGLTPGGPYVNLPIVAALYNTGAATSTLVAFLTGWSLWAFHRLPMEIAILGWRLTLIRLASVAVMPPLAGFIAQLLFKSARHIH